MLIQKVFQNGKLFSDFNVDNIPNPFILFPESRQFTGRLSPIAATKVGIYFLLFYTKSKKYFCLLKIIIKILVSTMFPKKYFRNTKKEKLPRPFETASLLAPYLCLLYELLHVYFYLFRELRADGTFYVFTSFRFIPFFSGMPSLFQLANPFLPCRFSGGGNAELLQEYPATSPIIVSSVFFLKVNNPFYVRWDPFIYPLGFDCQPSVVSG